MPDLSHPPIVDWPPLSEAELAVVRLVAKGLTNPAIAAEMFLSVNTIKTHLLAASKKLGVHSRLRVAAVARERGLIPQGDADD